MTTSGQVCTPQQVCLPKMVSVQECKSEPQCKTVTKQVWVPDPVPLTPVANKGIAPTPQGNTTGSAANLTPAQQQELARIRQPAQDIQAKLNAYQAQQSSAVAPSSTQRKTVTPGVSGLQTGNGNATGSFNQGKPMPTPGVSQPSAGEAEKIQELQAYKRQLEEKLSALQAQKKIQEQQKTGLSAPMIQQGKTEVNDGRTTDIKRVQEQVTGNPPALDKPKSISTLQPRDSATNPSHANTGHVASASAGWDRAWQSLKPSSSRQSQSAPIPALGRTVPDIYSQQYRTDMRKLVEAKTAFSARQAAESEGQCTDYARALFSNVKSASAPNLPPGIGDAKEWYAFARGSKEKYATAVPGAIARVPPGAIVVWGASEKNQLGHVGVVKTNDGTGKMTITEMNYGGNFDPVTGKTSNLGKVTERELNYHDMQNRPVYKDGQLSSSYPLEGFILPF